MPFAISSTLALLVLSTTPVSAQILPGHSVVGVSVGGVGEMYDIDHTAGTASQLTIGAPLIAEVPNAILMMDPVTGYVGTNNPGSTANIFAITIVGNVVTETQLNTTPTRGQNAAQLALVGGRLYFCVQDGSSGPGWIQSVSIGGGPVADELDLSTVGMTELVNGLCDIGGVIFCASFNSSPGNTATGPGELVQYDTMSQTGSLVMSLPVGKFDPNGNPWNTGIVNMMQYPAQPNLLALLGVYGDLLLIDPFNATVVRHDWTGTKNAGGNALASGSNNGLAWDPVSQDWLVSTRSGSVERWVHEQQANNMITGVGSDPTPTSNSTTSIHHIPFTTGLDESYGEGCQGNLSWEPTDASFGVPQAGNSSFGVGLFSLEAGDTVLLLLGLQNTTAGAMPLPLDLGFLGSPNCFLRTEILLELPAVAGAGAPGDASVRIATPLPPGTQGFTIYRQWAVFQNTATNPGGMVVSNARRLDIQ